MPVNMPHLLAIADAIATGSPVPWPADTNARDLAAPEIVKQFEVISRIADLHRGTYPRKWDGGLKDDGEPSPSTSPDDSTCDLDEPASWGALQLRGKLGQGAFGVVYKAWDPALRKEVALKLLRPEGRGRGDAFTLIAEARRLASVRHPNVISVYGADLREGAPGFWMEFIRGVTLDRVIVEQGPLGARESALIGIELCQALAAVHHAGLVHGDVKPRNVMREDGGRYVLMDFGAARDPRRLRETTRVSLVGTPNYMAPEIYMGQPATGLSDLYSLGVLMYYAVTREYPVTGTGLGGVRVAHHAGWRRHLRDARPDLPAGFVQTVERALSVNPADRFDSAGEMEQALVGTLTPAPAPRLLDRRTLLVGGLAAVASIVLAIVLARGFNPFAPDPATGVKRIAVLPFQNLGAADQQYVVDGVTDLLITRLSEIGALQVVSRTSSSQYRESAKTLPEIARELRADAVIEGSVLRSGTRVTISARLIHAGADAPIWAESFERDLSELLTLQGEVARAIATRIRATVTDSEELRLRSGNQVRIDAQDEFLRGAAALRQLTPESVRTAATHLESAVRIDSAYARAWALLSHAYWYLALVTTSVGERDGLQGRTRAAASRALDLDANLSRAHVALAQTRFYIDRDWAGAEEEFRRAIALDPSDADAREKIGWFLAAQARFDEALTQMGLARELDPMNAERRSPLAAVLYYARRYDEAAAELTALAAEKPGWLPAQMGLARVQAARGLTADALRTLDAPAYRAIVHVQIERARVQAVSGDVAGARQALDTLLARRASGEYIAPEVLAIVYIALGDLDAARALLDTAFAQREIGLVWLKVDPRFDRMRQDPRFIELLRSLGFL